MRNVPAPSKPDMVFLSYSQTSQDTVTFVRELRRQLELAGVRVWLDEEQLPPGSKLENRINSAIDRCSSALLIVTPDWIEKPWTRYEAARLAARKATLLVILRQEIELLDLGPELRDLLCFDWYVDAPDPHANLWRVYCGLRGIPPGPHELWSRQGRALIGSQEHSDRLPQIPSPGRRDVILDDETGQSPESLPKLVSTQVAGADLPVPVMELKNDATLWLLMDDRNVFSVSMRDLTIENAPRLKGGVADFVLDGDEPVASLYQPRLMRLRGKGWETVSMKATVLRMKATEFGIAMGGMDGTLSALDEDGVREVTRLDNAILDLQECDSNLVALSASGSVVRTVWPSDGHFQLLDTAALGRAVELFATGNGSRIGVMSQTRIGIWQATANWSLAVSPPISDGIDKVVPFGQRGLFAVISDVGQLWLVSPFASTAQRLPLPDTESPIANSVAGRPGNVFVWTRDGDAFLIQANGAVRSLSIPSVIWIHAAHERVAVSFQRDQLIARHFQI